MELRINNNNNNNDNNNNYKLSMNWQKNFNKLPETFYLFEMNSLTLFDPYKAYLITFYFNQSSGISHIFVTRFDIILKFPKD